MENKDFLCFLICIFIYFFGFVLIPFYLYQINLCSACDVSWVSPISLKLTLYNYFVQSYQDLILKCIQYPKRCFLTLSKCQPLCKDLFWKCEISDQRRQFIYLIFYMYVVIKEYNKKYYNCGMSFTNITKFTLTILYISNSNEQKI